MNTANGRAPGAVSVCVPAYQAERFLADTMESVLAQTFTDWEMIVLDNASSDRTGEIARSYDDPRIRVVRNDETLPLPANWNRVAGLARGRYLKVLCADDLIAPTCLAREVEVLDSRSDVALVSSRRDFITADGEIVVRGRGLEGLLGYQDAEAVVDRVVRSGINPIGWPSSVLIRRADYEAVDGFDDRWLHPIDLHLWLRILSHGGLYGIAETLASFRISEGSVTAGLTDTGAQHRLVLRTFAEESDWDISEADLRRGDRRSRIEELRLRLLFAAANSRSGRLRRLPGIVLERRWRRGSSAAVERSGTAVRVPPAAAAERIRSRPKAS